MILFQEIKEQICEQLEMELHERRQLSDEDLYSYIDAKIVELGKQQFLPLGQKCRLRSYLFSSFRQLGLLQELLDDPSVTEIMINGIRDIFIEQDGRVIKWEKSFETVEQLEDTIQQVVSRVNRMVNVSNPIVDARLEDGSRVHVVLPPIALDGPKVTIRKFPKPMTMDGLVSLQAIDKEAAQLLKKLVEAGYNIFISGGTNSGKTTFLNALSAYIKKEERVITIEDCAELQIQQVQNLVRMETRNANMEGEGALDIADLIKASLRMNPSRIVIGEVRGREALDMVSAMNTGHDGCLSTGHGNSPRDMLIRLETMILMGAELPLSAIRAQLASAIDIVIHLGRLRDKSRKVLSIVEVIGYEQGEVRLHPLFEFKEQGEGTKGRVIGRLENVGELKKTQKLIAAGIQL